MMVYTRKKQGAQSRLWGFLLISNVIAFIWWCALSCLSVFGWKVNWCNECNEKACLNLSKELSVALSRCLCWEVFEPKSGLWLSQIKAAVKQNGLCEAFMPPLIRIWGYQSCHWHKPEAPDWKKAFCDSLEGWYKYCDMSPLPFSTSQEPHLPTLRATWEQQLLSSCCHRHVCAANPHARSLKRNPKDGLTAPLASCCSEIPAQEMHPPSTPLQCNWEMGVRLPPLALRALFCGWGEGRAGSRMEELCFPSLLGARASRDNFPGEEKDWGERNKKITGCLFLESLPCLCFFPHLRKFCDVDFESSPILSLLYWHF